MALIDDLLATAEKIAHFGILSGRITDTKLLAAISDAQTAKANKTLTAGGPTAMALSVAVQDAARMISPATVADLNLDWDPFDKTKPKESNRARWVTLAVTVGLVFTAAYYTLWHRRATDLMTFAVDQAVDTQRDAIVEMMLPVLARVSAAKAAAQGDGAQDSPIQFAILLRDVEKIRAMQQTIDDFTLKFQQLDGERIMGVNQVSQVWQAVFASKDDAATAAPAPGTAQAATAPDADASSPEGAPAAAPEPAASRQVTCGFPGTDGQGAEAGRIMPTVDYLDSIDVIRACLTDAMNVTPPAVDDLESLHKTMYRFDHALNLFGSWILPAIYGALGALIYYMRQFLDPLRKDPPFERVVMRVSLGAFAGITIGWFFTPTTLAQGFQFPDVGMAILTFAFVLGFSIEVFFGFLERLVSLSNEGVARLGKSG